MVQRNRIASLILAIAFLLGAKAAYSSFFFTSILGAGDGRNYFGDGSDGAAVISADTSLTSSLDGDIVVKNYTSITINSGKTLTTLTRCKGLIVFVQGDCTINGTLTMTARGANADPVVAGVGSGGLQFPMLKSGGTSSALSASDFSGTGIAAITAMQNMPDVTSGVTFWVNRSGGKAGTPSYGPGGAGNGHQSGGGGAGGNESLNQGSGSDGTCFSGGSAGGGGDSAGNAAPYGGVGGYGVTPCRGGGSGNPCGANGTGGVPGTGGLLVLIVGGNLTVGASGVISSDGSKGADGTDCGGSNGAGGGGSGGGNVILAYAGSYTNSGAVRASGGTGGTGSAGTNGNPGGAGSIQTAQVDAR